VCVLVCVCIPRLFLVNPGICVRVNVCVCASVCVRVLVCMREKECMSVFVRVNQDCLRLVNFEIVL